MNLIPLHLLEIFTAFDKDTEKMKYKIPPLKYFKTTSAWRVWGYQKDGKLVDGDVVGFQRRKMKTMLAHMVHSRAVTPIPLEVALSTEMRRAGIDLAFVDSLIATITEPDAWGSMKGAINDWALLVGAKDFHNWDHIFCHIIKHNLFQTYHHDETAVNLRPNNRYPWDTLNQIGDNFTVPWDDMPRSGRGCLIILAKHKGKRISTNQTPDGLLVTYRGEL